MSSIKKTIFCWTKTWLSNQNIPSCFLDRMASSNDQAKEYAFQNNVPFSVFLVAQQNQGRGQGKAQWQDSDLMISFLWNKNLKEIQMESCEAFAKDLKQALNRVWPEIPINVKKPNDLYVGKEGKVAGILMEFLSQGLQKALVVGLGLNVFSFPKDLPATSLGEYTKNINFSSWQLFLEHLFYLWKQRASDS